MTIEEAKRIAETTESPFLKRDMQKFIRRQEKHLKYGKQQKISPDCSGE